MAADILRADIVLKGGLVIDGRGLPAFAADVALRGDTIIAVGDLANVTAERVIEVTGPGRMRRASLTLIPMTI